MRTDGSDVRQLTDGPGFDAFPDWSPNGKRIAFTSDRDGDGDPETYDPDIYLMDADGGNVTRLTFGLVADSPVFSPDGTKILFTTFNGPPRIWVMDADGSNQVALTDALNAEASWSPNGTQIAFISRRDGKPEVYIMDADGGNATRLTSDDNRDFGPVVFSPNGRELAFASRRSGNTDIYALSLRTGAVRRLTTNPAFDGFPEWAPGNLNSP